MGNKPIRVFDASLMKLSRWTKKWIEIISKSALRLSSVWSLCEQASRMEFLLLNMTYLLLPNDNLMGQSPMTRGWLWALSGWVENIFEILLISTSTFTTNDYWWPWVFWEIFKNLLISSLTGLISAFSRSIPLWYVIVIR